LVAAGTALTVELVS
jgi:hypothetical protein